MHDIGICIKLKLFEWRRDLLIADILPPGIDDVGRIKIKVHPHPHDVAVTATTRHPVLGEAATLTRYNNILLSHPKRFHRTPFEYMERILLEACKTLKYVTHPIRKSIARKIELKYANKCFPIKFE